MSTYHDIVDYRKTSSYAHWKLRSPGVEDYKLLIGNLVFIVNERVIKLSNCNAIFPHWLEDDIMQYVKGEVSLASLDRINIMDGIYDIWLRDISNLESVSVYIDGVGLVYQHTLTDDELNKGSFQIPLAFQTNGERVQKYLFDGYKAPYRISWIPTEPLRQKDIRIVLNDGAAAKLYLSTVYFPRLNRAYLMFKDTEFYINGKPIIHTYDSGYTNTPRQTWWEWLVSSITSTKPKKQ